MVELSRKSGLPLGVLPSAKSSSKDKAAAAQDGAFAF